MNVALDLTTSAADFGGACAIRLDGDACSYRMLDATSARMAGALRAQGIRPGDPVALMLPNVPQFAIAAFGVLRAGAVLVPLDVELGGHELELTLSRCDVRLLIAWHEVAPAAEAAARRAGAEVLCVAPRSLGRLLASFEPAREIVERAPSDPAAVVEGRERTHADLHAAVEALGARHAFDPATVLLAALPLSESLDQLCAAVAAGAVVTLLPHFDPEHARAVVERDEVTVLHGTAPMLAALGDVEIERCTEPSPRFERSRGGRLHA